MKKNETFIGTCSGYTKDGLGIVKHDNFVLFVSNMIKGEEAEILVMKVKPTYGFGKVIKLLKTSEHRVEPQCSVYKTCGGCHLQHMDEVEQANFKEDIVKDCFKSIAHKEIECEPIITMEQPLRYRNKVQVPVQNINGLKVGFYRKHSNDIVEFDDCLVQTKESNEIVQFMKEKIKQYHLENVYRHVLIKHAHVSNEVMVVLVVNKFPFDHHKELANDLLKQFNNIEAIIANVNDKDTNVVLGEKEYALTKKDMIQEELLGLKFNISSKSFFQINPVQTAKLYSKALEFADCDSNDTVIDLYCGTGTIGLLASRTCKKVYGIEIVADAIKDAKKNAENNGITNIEFINADAKLGANELLNRKINPDVVIVDPPRKGCDKPTLEAIHTMSPKRLVYVSCDPATLARDVEILETMNFKLEKVQPVDMFPKTVHIENVALLIRK